MQRLILAFFAAFLAFALPMHDAEAKRLGGGKSFGMQRQAPMKREAAPQQSPSQNQAQNAAPGQSPANAATQPGKRSWMGPIAGLAAGLGLAALASHLGFGEELANFLMIALLAMAAIFLVTWLMRRNKPAASQPLQYAGAGNAPQAPRFEAVQPVSGSVAAMNDAPAAQFPPGFDVQAFSRQAKVNFLRLQAAHDAGNLDDIREFTTPEMYAEIKLDLDDRTGTSRTEVTRLEADVLEAVEDGNRHIVSVRFSGELKEDGGASESFDETWHLTRPASGDKGWLVAGIQQNG